MTAAWRRCVVVWGPINNARVQSCCRDTIITQQRPATPRHAPPRHATPRAGTRRCHHVVRVCSYSRGRGAGPQAPDGPQVRTEVRRLKVAMCFRGCAQIRPCSQIRP